MCPNGTLDHLGSAETETLHQGHSNGGREEVQVEGTTAQERHDQAGEAPSEPVDQDSIVPAQAENDEQIRALRQSDCSPTCGSAAPP